MTTSGHDSYLHQQTSAFLLGFLQENSRLPVFHSVEVNPRRTPPTKNFPHPRPFYWIPQSQILSFETDHEASRRLENQLPEFPAHCAHHAIALLDHTAAQTFHETINPLHSSLYPPATNQLCHFSNLEGLKVHRTAEVTTTTLDLFWETHPQPLPDLVAVNGPGTEFAILRGAEKTLTEAVALIVNVFFQPLYENQAPFAEIDLWLRAHGFQLHHFRDSKTNRLAQTEIYTQPQLINAEAVYFPAPDRIATLPAARLLPLAIAASLYDAIDLTQHTLQKYDIATDQTLAPDFYAAFMRRFNPAQAGLRPKHIEKGVPEWKTVFLPLIDGTSVAVPDTLSLMTPYILREQGDWFEAELPWLRRWLKPGMRVLDIGANYGVYSLPSARAVGPTGQVWSVEPTPKVFAYLEKSRDKNNFSQLRLFPLALALAHGEATFYLSAQSEWNSLTPTEGDAVAIRVPTERLDDFAQAQNIHQVDFVKLDAEGEEINIIESGRTFFTVENPLVLFDLKQGRHLQVEIADKFTALGYDIYRLMPEPGILVPFDRFGLADQQLINAFACKPARAEELEKQGLLCRSIELPDEVNLPPDAHRHYLSQFAYGQRFAERLPRSHETRGIEKYLHGLDAFCVSLLPGLPPAQRVGLLDYSFEKIHQATAEETTLPRLLSLARVAWACGRVDLASQILTQLSLDILNGTTFYLNEPFVNPAPDFDFVEPQTEPASWCVAAILHQRIKLSGYSTFYASHPPLNELRHLEKLGHLLPAMRARLEVVLQRYAPR